MLHTVGLRKRFFITLSLIFICSLPVMIGGSYVVLKKNIDAETFEKAQFYLSTIESVRKQIGKVTRPAVMAKLPNDLVALSIGDLRKSPPDYISMRQSRCSNKPVEPW